MAKDRGGYTIYGVNMTAADIISRSDIGTGTDNGFDVALFEDINMSDIQSVLGETSNNLGDLIDSSSVSQYSQFKSTAGKYDIGDFAGYNHEAKRPEIKFPNLPEADPLYITGINCDPSTLGEYYIINLGELEREDPSPGIHVFDVKISDNSIIKVEPKLPLKRDDVKKESAENVYVQNDNEELIIYPLQNSTEDIDFIAVSLANTADDAPGIPDRFGAITPMNILGGASWFFATSSTDETDTSLGGGDCPDYDDKNLRRIRQFMDNNCVYVHAGVVDTYIVEDYHFLTTSDTPIKFTKINPGVRYRLDYQLSIEFNAPAIEQAPSISDNSLDYNGDFNLQVFRLSDDTPISDVYTIHLEGTIPGDQMHEIESDPGNNISTLFCKMDNVLDFQNVIINGDPNATEPYDIYVKIEVDNFHNGFETSAVTASNCGFPCSQTDTFVSTMRFISGNPAGYFYNIPLGNIGMVALLEELEEITETITKTVTTNAHFYYPYYRNAGFWSFNGVLGEHLGINNPIFESDSQYPLKFVDDTPFVDGTQSLDITPLIEGPLPVAIPSGGLQPRYDYFSMAVWIKRDPSVPMVMPAIYYIGESTAGDDLMFSISSTGGLMFWYERATPDGSITQEFRCTTDFSWFNEFEWHHVGFVVDFRNVGDPQLSPTDLLKIYVDGHETTWTIAANSLSLLPVFDGTLISLGHNKTDFLNGYMVGFGFWNTKLTDFDFKWLYNQKSPALPDKPMGLTFENTTGADVSVTLPISGSNLNAFVYTANGKIPTNYKTENPTITLLEGTTKMYISGIVKNINFDGVNAAQYLTTINSLGVTGLITGENSFANCTNLQYANLATIDQNIDLKITRNMFANDTGLEQVYTYMSEYDSKMNNLYNMEAMFSGCRNLYIMAMSGWDLTTEDPILNRFMLDCSGYIGTIPGSVFWENTEIVEHEDAFKGCINAYNYDEVPEDWGRLPLLNTPTITTFNGENATLSVYWEDTNTDEVGYAIEVDGNYHELPANTTTYSEVVERPPDLRTFRVRAIGDGDNNTDSEWSQMYTATITPAMPANKYVAYNTYVDVEDSSSDFINVINEILPMDPNATAILMKVAINVDTASLDNKWSIHAYFEGSNPLDEPYRNYKDGPRRYESGLPYEATVNNVLTWKQPVPSNNRFLVDVKRDAGDQCTWIYYAIIVEYLYD